MLWLAALCVCSGALAATTKNHAGATPGKWCGGVQWRLMTLSDPDRMKVHLDRIPTSIADLSAQTPPKRIGVRRTTGFQLVSWRMQAVVDRYRMASNGEIVLVLYDIPSGKYMDAYLPNPHCLGPRARDRSGMIAARSAFTSHCPQPTPQWQLVGATVDISGVGFWNPVTTTRGALPNGAELRPLTNLTIISGCGVGTS
jgi:hypothetical protein